MLQNQIHLNKKTYISCRVEDKFVKYFVDTVDKRNQVLKEILIENGFETFKFDFNDLSNIKRGDTIVFSPAKKFTEEEIKKLPAKTKIVCGNLSPEYLKVLKDKKIVLRRYA